MELRIVVFLFDHSFSISDGPFIVFLKLKGSDYLEILKLWMLESLNQWRSLYSSSLSLLKENLEFLAFKFDGSKYIVIFFS